MGPTAQGLDVQAPASASTPRWRDTLLACHAVERVSWAAWESLGHGPDRNLNQLDVCYASEMRPPNQFDPIRIIRIIYFPFRCFHWPTKEPGCSIFLGPKQSRPLRQQAPIQIWWMQHSYNQQAEKGADITTCLTCKMFKTQCGLLTVKTLHPSPPWPVDVPSAKPLQYQGVGSNFA